MRASKKPLGHPLHTILELRSTTTRLRSTGNDVSSCYATNGLPRNSPLSYGFPSNKFVNVWACTRYVKYHNSFVIFNVARTRPHLNNYVTYIYIVFCVGG